jgi:hypothetical protein
VYKQDADGLKTKNTTLQTLIQAILNWPEEEVPGLVSDIRSCESLDDVAEKIIAKENGLNAEEDDGDAGIHDDDSTTDGTTFESHLFGRMGDLRLDDEGFRQYVGGTSTLIHTTDLQSDLTANLDEFEQQENPITSWTNVTDDPELVLHLVNMYFTWHYTFFTTVCNHCPNYVSDIPLTRRTDVEDSILEGLLTWPTICEYRWQDILLFPCTGQCNPGTRLSLHIQPWRIRCKRRLGHCWRPLLP